MPPALRAIGRDADLAKGTTLWGIGRDNTEAEIDRAIELFAEVTAKLRSMSPVQ
jgi:cysteine sulfinate desulfinase/cysteine desulfurase-like protein